MNRPLDQTDLSGPDSPGLSEAQARERLLRTGPNTVPLPEPSPIRRVVQKFWGPVPWMLEVAGLLEFLTGKTMEGGIVFLLLLMNGVFAFIQEEKGQKALRLLQERMEVTARVRRDGQWKIIPARDIVVGDLVHVRMGDFVPADMRLESGTPLLDQSSLTGESMPVSKGKGDELFAGTVLRRGEGTGNVLRTGGQCAYGKTVQLLHDSHTRSHAEETVLQIVKSLLMVDLLLAFVIVPLAYETGVPFSSLVAFLLILVLSAIPIALPPMFTLANALSALVLGKVQVLVTKLSAISDAAAMEELVCDKTGTLTENRLEVHEITPVPGRSENEVLKAAMDASDLSSQDPLDMAVITAGVKRGLVQSPPSTRARFIPFDPETKRTEVFISLDGRTLRIIKGSPALLASEGLLNSPPGIASGGQRPVAVLSGPREGPLSFLGVISFSDRLRADSHSTLARLRDLGIRIRLASGDTPDAALPLGRTLGFSGPVCTTTRSGFRDECELYAGILPEDKFFLIREIQNRGRIVGMTGDGVNDAPALHQAEVGIAVSHATDIARASAGLVLLSPGLSGLLDVVKEGRRVTRRLQSYILNKIVKTLEIALFLTGGLLLLHTAVIGSLQILLLIFTNDFVTLALASDQAKPSNRPDPIRVGETLKMGFLYAGSWLFLTFSIFRVGQTLLHLSHDECQTLSFLTLVLTGIGNVLVVRDPGPFYRSLPSRPLFMILAADVVVAGVLSGTSVLMDPLPVSVILGVLVAVGGATFAIDLLKRLGRKVALRI